MRKKIIMICGAICIFILIIMSIYLHIMRINSMSYKLQKLGYTKEQTKEIINLTSTDKIKEILNKEYDENLLTFLKEKYFMWKNLDKYLSYYKENKDKTTTDVVSIINVGADNDWYTNYTDTDLSKGYQMLVNKFHKLSENYEPEDIVKIKNWYAYAGNSIREEVYNAFVDMYNDAKKEDVTLIVNSSYRSYQEQEETYELNYKAHGKKYADDFAAHPGFSEHQTGLALDIMTTGTNRYTFEKSDAFTWLSNNAHKYGFILRYPKDKQYLTGYDYESWHYRYVGKEVATEIKHLGITYDEYYAYYIEN